MVRVFQAAIRGTMPVMAEEPEKSPQEPNLELSPLLGFGRKKRARKARRDSAEQVSPDAGQGAAEDPGAVSEVTAAEGDDPLSADPVPEPRGGLAPATGATRRLPPVPPPSRSGGAPPSRISTPPPHAATERSSDRAVDPPATDASPEPEPATPAPVPVAQAPVEQSPQEETTLLPGAGREERIDDSSESSVSAADHRDTMTAAHAGPDFTAADQEPVGSPGESTPVEDSASPRKPRRTRKPREPRKRPSLKLPVISPLIAAVVTGLLVGLLTVVLTYATNRACEGVRGVGSCGRFGLLALLLIVAMDVLVGAALLKAWRMSDPTSTAFLGVGLMAVFALLFLLDVLGSTWMLLVIPLVAAVAFLTSWWVTTSFVEENRDVPR